MKRVEILWRKPEYPYELFYRERRYVAPLYQRPYVWTQEDQWEPLWEGIERQAAACLDAEADEFVRNYP